VAVAAAMAAKTMVVMTNRRKSTEDLTYLKTAIQMAVFFLTL
jgi:hypothetical protein